MIVFSGKVHFGFALIIWALINVGVEGNGGSFINPIPFLIGSVFPDCDHRNAPMGRIFPMWLFFKHRGFTHSLLCMVCFTLLVGTLTNWTWAIGFAAGYLLHLAMDDSTPMGIKWMTGHRRKRKRAY